MSALTTLLPGFGLAAIAVGISFAISNLIPAVSALTIAVVLGAIFGNLPVNQTMFRPGLRWVTSKLLRFGIVLLGLRLAIPDVLSLGAASLSIVVALVIITFFGTRWLGQLLGLSKGTSLLVATGFSICGASAIAAMNGVRKNEDEDVATSVAMVTLFGSLAIVTLPLLGKAFGLSDREFGMWVGASVHDVAQTVATASAVGPAAISIAVVVKLTRVILLAPMVAAVGIMDRRKDSQPTEGKRPAIIPLFVLGFIAMVALRSTGWVSSDILAIAKTIETLALSAALFGLGSTVNIRKLLSTGGRALLLGLISWVLIAGLALVGVLLIN